MPRAVILTALPVEYLAVRHHLADLQEEMHPQGTIYERGKFAASGQTWEVGIVEVGAGNAGAAVEAERAIAYFKPDILFFVGIAGGIKDVAIGDVVAATDVYAYESGKEDAQRFLTRPKAGKSAYALVQRAKSEARKGEWLQRLANSPTLQPRVFVAPIVAGEKVVASRESDVFKLIRASYNDAIAIEMEGYGFLSAAFAYPEIKSIVIRGISDLVEGKNDDSVEPEETRQEKASLHASAFAFEILSKLEIIASDLPKLDREPTAKTMNPQQLDQLEDELKSLDRTPDSEEEIEVIRINAQSNFPQDNTIDDNHDFDYLIRQTNFRRISPRKFNLVEDALEKLPSLIKDKKDRQKTSQELRDNIKSEDAINFISTDTNISKLIINDFLKGNPIDQDNFLRISLMLKLDWKSIVDINFIVQQSGVVIPSIKNVEIRETINNVKTEIINTKEYYLRNIQILISTWLDNVSNNISIQYIYLHHFIQSFAILTIVEKKCIGEISKFQNFQVSLMGGDWIEIDYFKDICSSFHIEWKKNIDLNAFLDRVQLLKVSPEKFDLESATIEEKLQVVDLIKKKKEIRKSKAEELTKNITLEEKIKLISEDFQDTNVENQNLILKHIEYFLTRKPIDRNIFENICSELNLNWKQIVDFDFLVDTVWVKASKEKYRETINQQCGTMLVLEVPRPISLDELYVDVNILDEPNSYRRLDINELYQFYPNREIQSKREIFNRFGLEEIAQTRIPALNIVENYSNLMILGKPGSGKTTFLKNVAVQCINNRILNYLLPIFIRIKDLIKFLKANKNKKLINYIIDELVACGERENSIYLEKILTYGKSLILLDGLDEVAESDNYRIIQEIEDFHHKYYKNKFIITCRIAAQPQRLEKFTYVEIADLDEKQVEIFARKWFASIAKNSSQESGLQADNFLEKLNSTENQQIREIVITPILLNLICSVFQAKANFPSNRAKLYENGIEILLKKWDEAKGIERDEVYRGLSLGHKIEILTQVAAITFKKGHFLFQQQEVQDCISSYLCTLSNPQVSPLNCQEISGVVLKSIEAQHGLLVERACQIYSFSHLTFHEYFTAKALIDSFTSSGIKNVFSETENLQIANKNWREVFILATNMLQNADELLLLINQEIDIFISSDIELQNFLNWLHVKSLNVVDQGSLSGIRAFYLELELINKFNNIVFREDFAIASKIARNYDLAFPDALDLDLTIDLNITLQFHRICDLTYNSCLDRPLIEDIILNLQNILDFDLDPIFLQSMRQHITILTALNQDRENFETWWHINYKNWIDELRILIVKHRNICHNWLWMNEKRKNVHQYYNMNNLLIDCLNSGCQVSPEIRRKIEDNLLMPIDMIENMVS